MRKLIALLSAALLATPAFAGGTVALNDAEPEAIQQATERRWAIEVEAGRAEIATQAGNGSLTYDYTSGCEMARYSHLCSEDPRSSFRGFAVYWALNEQYSFGLRYQEMDNLYELTVPSTVEVTAQDVKLITLSVRRHFRNAAALRPFIELGVGRYTSKATYTFTGVRSHEDTYSAWSPTIAIGAFTKISERWSIVPTLRYIDTVGERSGLLYNGSYAIRTLDEPVTQLSIGLRFEL